jgi:Gamma-glutamylcysteine synthetase
MMYKTAGTQLNLDYTSEEDFIKKFKLANNLVPISIGLFANSSIVEKSNSGYLSYRSKVWQETSRGGLPEFFLKDVNFEKYADYIMNYPILFLQSEGNYISGKKYLFKNFMNGEIKEIGNKIPSTNDLDTHLGTIFTENRLKQYIELRSMDACGWECLCAGPALFTGLLYGNLEEALDLIKNWEADEVLSAYKNAPKDGLKTNLMGKDISYWAEKLIDISKSGLKKRDFLNRKKLSEAKFLDHLEKIVKNKKTNADNIISKYSNSEKFE